MDGWVKWPYFVEFVDQRARSEWHSSCLIRTPLLNFSLQILWLLKYVTWKYPSITPSIQVPKNKYYRLNFSIFDQSHCIYTFISGFICGVNSESLSMLVNIRTIKSASTISVNPLFEKDNKVLASLQKMSWI